MDTITFSPFVDGGKASQHQTDETEVQYHRVVFHGGNDDIAEQEYAQYCTDAQRDQEFDVFLKILRAECVHDLIIYIQYNCHGASAYARNGVGDTYQQTKNSGFQVLHQNVLLTKQYSFCRYFAALTLFYTQAKKMSTESNMKRSE